jgi:hypothetical protein
MGAEWTDDPQVPFQTGLLVSLSSLPVRPGPGSRPDRDKPIHVVQQPERSSQVVP